MILNSIQLEASTRHRDEQRFAEITGTSPVGQTFVTGDAAEEIYRIAIWQAFWNDTWQADEILVLTLWDSPQKKISLGRSAIPYATRMWEGAIPMFTIEARVEPKHEYYFELTVQTESLRPAETPREWLLSSERPGFAGGDRTLAGIGIAKDNDATGQAYVGGKPQDYDLWFEVHSRKRLDRDAVYGRAFDRFDLDYPPLSQVRAAVAVQDWDRAVAELIRYFESRTDLIDATRRTPRPDLAFDTREADLAARQHVLVPQDGTIVNLGPNWNYFALWPQRGGVGLTRGGLRKPLAEGYERTGNPKYARAFNDMLESFFINCPSPILAGVFRPSDEIPASLGSGLSGGSMWSALAIGARMLHGLHYYTTFIDSPFFTPDVRAAFLINLGEMAEVLERQKGGGNWATQMADALFQFGLNYPEFKGARGRIEGGLSALIANARETVRPDGALREPTINYHMLVLNRYSKVIQQCRTLGLDVPPEMVDLTQRMFEFVMYSTLPDGTLPIWGDSNHPSRPELLERGAQMYGRGDFRYVFTGGKEGSPPAKTSTGFPDSGFYYMRSGWTSDANYFGAHCGRFGSHGHHDALSFVAAAHGRTVLIDPGIHTYGTPVARELTSTRSHNTITVDDHDAGSAIADMWLTTDGFDYLAGHTEGYRGLNDVRHSRRIWFLKADAEQPDMWVIFDDIMAASEHEGEHNAVLRYRFAPLKVSHDTATAAVWTDEPDRNLAIRVLSDGVIPRLDLGEGIAVWGDLIQVPVAAFSRRGPLPITFTSILVPSKANATPIDARLVPAEGNPPGARAVWVESGNLAILVAAGGLTDSAENPTLCRWKLPDGRPVELEGVGVAMRFQRQDNAWHQGGVYEVGARLVKLDGREVSPATPRP